MRRCAWLVLAALVAVSPAVYAGPREDDLARARVLDQQGVRAYKEARFNDAISYFSEAFKLGGPASELWNIAKCYVRLDQPQEAIDAYERYLVQPGLSAQDKAEATSQMEELRRRRSILTIASQPSHATVYLDGKRSEPAGTTPFSVQVAAGSHKVEIEAKGYRLYSQEVEAKFGRAIIVDAQLARDPSVTPDKRSAVGAYGARRFTADAQAGIVLSKLGGGATQGARVGLALGGAYWIVDSPSGMLGLGVRVSLTTDAWGNTINAPNMAPSCAQAIPVDQSATEVGAFGVGVFGYRVTPRLRIGADAGLGVAGYGAGTLGGDLFYPTCRPDTGVQIAAHAGLEVSYSVLPVLRALVTPLSLQVHPSYDGARSAPIDATGAWLRFGAALGLAVDL